jgi:hypothetical protein
MLDQRRHQRIRFGTLPKVRIGYGGVVGEGEIENLSLSGLMVRTPMGLSIGQTAGCEFSLSGSPLIDVPMAVASRIGDLFGSRFLIGPLSGVVIEDAIGLALAGGQASTLSVHELAGRKVMRISGGLNGALRNDFMHALTRVGVDEIDVEAVTAVDQGGMALCLVATTRHGVLMGAQSACFATAWREALAIPGEINKNTGVGG